MVHLHTTFLTKISPSSHYQQRKSLYFPKSLIPSLWLSKDQPHTISHFTGSPPTIFFPVFSANDFLPKSPHICSITPTPIAQQCSIEGQQASHPQPSLAFTWIDNGLLNQKGFPLKSPSFLKEILLDLLWPQPDCPQGTEEGYKINRYTGKSATD